MINILYLGINLDFKPSTISIFLGNHLQSLEEELVHLNKL
jgi:hypothetical protein